MRCAYVLNVDKWNADLALKNLLIRFPEENQYILAMFVCLQALKIANYFQKDNNNQSMLKTSLFIRDIPCEKYATCFSK